MIIYYFICSYDHFLEGEEGKPNKSVDFNNVCLPAQRAVDEI